MRKLTWVICGLLVVLGGSTLAQDPPQQLTEAQRAKWAAATPEQRADWLVRLEMTEGNPPAKRRGATDTVLGTIQYDPGAPADLYRSNGGNTDNSMGNVFNTASGSPLKAAGTITGVSVFARLGGATGTGPGPSCAAGISFFNLPNVTGSAVNIGYEGLGTIPANSFVPMTISPTQMMAGGFMAGIYQGTFAGSDSIGLRTGTTNGQGHHAFQISFNGTTSTGYTTIPGEKQRRGRKAASFTF